MPYISISATATTTSKGRPQMAQLKHGTTPLDREAKAAKHEAEAARISTLLGMNISSAYREQLQVALLREVGAAHALRQPPAKGGGRMKSFVGTDRYEWNG